MGLSHSLLLKLGRKYTPSSIIALKFRGKDVAVKTDDDGNAVVVFIGKADADGRIKGERYTRTLKSDERGVIIKDHWDRKGRSE